MGSRGPKPGFKRVARVAAPLDPVPTIDRETLARAERAAHRDPLERSRDIKTMEGDTLKAYAKQIGVRQRDIDELSPDRLRQNCMLTVSSLIEALTE